MAAQRCHFIRLVRYHMLWDLASNSLVGAARGGYLARLHHHGAGLGEGVVAVALVVPVRTCERGSARSLNAILY